MPERKLTDDSINASQVLGAPLYLVNEEWYNAWIAFTKQSWGLLTMTMTQWWAPTIVRVSGDSTMRGQLLQTTDGGLLCNFPERMVLMANHQIYTDWLYLWWIGYAAGMHGRIYVVLKESLKRIPVIGWGMQFAQFIFLKRKWEEDKPRLAAHMQKFKNKDPMWLMMFPEGTNLADCTRETSQKWAAKNGIKDMQHMLLPRSTGLHFMLDELKDTVDYVYDCTIAYEGVPRGQYAQDIFTVGASYFGGRPPKSVNMYWRRFRVVNIPLDDPQKFDLWLRARWSEKDRFIENWYRTGRFPADNGSSKDYEGKNTSGAGYIEAEVKPQRWYEFLQVFAPIGLFALVLYIFYGSLPQDTINKIKSIDQKTVIKQLDAIQKGQMKVPETKDLLATAPKHLQNRFDAVKKLAEARNTTPERVIAQLQDPEGATVVDKVAKAVEPQKAAAKPKPSKIPGNPNPDPSIVAPSKAAEKAPATRKALSKIPGNPNPNPAVTAPSNATEKAPSKRKPASKKPTITSSDASGMTAKAKLAAKTTPVNTEIKSQPSNTQAAPSIKKSDPKPKPQPVAMSRKVSPSAAYSKIVKPANIVAKPPTAADKSVSHQKATATPADTNGEKEIDNAEVRKARRKLELRQGKQEPPRKIRRALQAK